MIGDYFRGQVLENVDLLFMGRVLVYVPALDVTHYAYPLGMFGALAVPAEHSWVVVLRPKGRYGAWYVMGVWLPFLPEFADLLPVPAVGTKEVRAACRKAALKYGLPPALVLAIVRKESTFRPKAYNDGASSGQWTKRVKPRPDLVMSRAGGQKLKKHAHFEDSTKWGAYGLGQLMLLTALDRGFPLTSDPDELFDVETNLKYACRLLKIFWGYSGHDPRWTAAMYHAGSGAVKKNDPSKWPDGKRSTVKYSKTVLGYYKSEGGS